MGSTWLLLYYPLQGNAPLAIHSPQASTTKKHAVTHGQRASWVVMLVALSPLTLQTTHIPSKEENDVANKNSINERRSNTDRIMQEPTGQETGIHWSSISRNGIVLCKAGQDGFLGQHVNVTQVAQTLLKKRPTPGYEYYSPFRSPLKGIKFHVYEATQESSELFIWAFACVYDSTVISKDQAQSFLEKICGITQIEREEKWCWRHGKELAAQESFAPILQQRMEEVTYRGRATMVNQHVDSNKEQMGRNIDLLLERGDKLEDLQQEATKLEEMSCAFQKKAKKLRRVQMWQNAKYGLVVGTIVTAGVAVIVVPPVVSLL